ncbi:alkaline phosphatase [Pseudoflavitalea rhizosphaerae]|uniref:alkaline phosphatase n=1 Tax=Pseudoflavitalea rhizosphaerae TaxID=1884793 RepID=UPI000F8E0407|nr:alkaline phosphatase [Pseudoflavitalea rhizosphaerae]
MQRRDFFRNGSLALLGTTLTGHPILGNTIDSKPGKQQAHNIIFLVSDGMSTGTLNMASLLKQRKEGSQSHWMKLYEEKKVVKALMDTASASSMVTDSAAGSSSWGGGVRVNNGSLNVSPDGTKHTPILQKFKAAGKSVGCVTTVPITHATPAGFCINNNKRGDQAEIATQYLPLRFDVMMGGGLEYFTADKRKDKQDLLSVYRQQSYEVALTREEMMKADGKKPLLGVFHEDGLPYALDRLQNKDHINTIPTLAEMTAKAIEVMSSNKKGFVLQVESGKVDWAAHANDVGALLYDQLQFDDAVKVAIDFAEKDRNTLVIITTDHGNANPGLFYGDKANSNFDHIQHFKHTNDWILNGINKNFTTQQVIERIEYAQGIVLQQQEAGELLKHYSALDESGLYNPRKLPFKYLAQLQQSFTSVGWGSMDHSADYVELAAYGPGSELLKPFLKNTDLHYLMLNATGVKHNN